MKARILATMATALAAMESPQYRTNRTGNINTPGNFKKCPKGAQEFKFYYTKDEVEHEYKCYARTIDNAREKFVKFLKVNSYKQ